MTSNFKYKILEKIVHNNIILFIRNSWVHLNEKKIKIHQKKVLKMMWNSGKTLTWYL